MIHNEINLESLRISFKSLGLQSYSAKNTPAFSFNISSWQVLFPKHPLSTCLHIFSTQMQNCEQRQKTD